MSIVFKNLFNKRGILRIAVCLSAVFAMVFVSVPDKAFAAEEEISYEVVIEDDAELLTAEQEAELYQIMEPITAYGHVALLTTNENISTPEEYNWAFYDRSWGTESGIIFLIDMDNRVLQMNSDGAIYKMIDDNYMDTITDNTYMYAVNEDYFGCAKEAFTEVYQLLEGKRIAQPMKYITNALLSLVIAVVLMFGIVLGMRNKKAISNEEMLEYIDYYCRINKPEKVLRSKTKLGGSGGGGGGHSSGGGSHHSSGSSHHSSGGGSRSSGGSHRSSGGGGSHKF